MFSNISAKKFMSACAALLCSLVIALCPVSVGAEDNSIRISELSDMTITLPSDMAAATRSSKDTDKYFSVFGLNFERTMTDFAANDIYLQGMDKDLETTVTVTMTKTADSESIGDYSKLSSDKLYEVQNNFLTNGEYISCTPDQAEKITWLILEANVTSDGKTIKAYQANTVYDGMSINVTLQHNNGDVTSDDFKTFSGIVSSVFFDDTAFMRGAIIYICIGAGVLVVAVIVILAIAAKKARKKGKKHKNDKILEELASKYTTNRRKYSNEYDETDSGYEDINGRLSHNHLDETDDEDYAEEKVKTYEKSVSVSEDEITKIVEETLNKDKAGQPVFTASSESDEPEENEETEQTELEEEPYDEETEAYDDDADDELDEELVRAEAKRGKFNDSYDFFEEAPKKVVGIINSADLKNAEDYDVILEEEKRVKKIEREEKPEKSTSFITVLAGIGAGIKSFGVHLGYFATNVSRMIKRKRAMKKRRKAEEERRERERRRREMQSRQRREENGLVRMHSASDRRTPPTQHRTAPSRRPAQNRPHRNSASVRKPNDSDIHRR